MFFREFDSDAVFNVVEYDVPAAAGDVVGDLDALKNVLIVGDAFHQCGNVFRSSLADNQENRMVRRVIGFNDVSFAVNGAEFVVKLPDALHLPFTDINLDDVGKKAAFDDGVTYPGQLFDFLLQIAKIQIKDVGFAAELQGVENILFGGFVAAGDDNVVYFEAQAGAVVVKFRAEVGEFAADEVGLNGNDDGRQHKNNPQQKQVSG